MRKIITVILLLPITFIAKASAIHKLSIGDTVPNLTLEKIINAKINKADLRDFRGKFLILDFWTTTCSACIAQFPKLEALQERFKEKLIVLPVCIAGWYGKNEVENFMAKQQKLGRVISLPVAVQYYDDTDKTSLVTLFPTDGYPHEVWIDDKGIIKAISDAVFVNETNIKSFLDGKLLSIPVKNSQIGFNSAIPLLTEGNGGPDSSFLYRSVITKYIDSIKSYGLEKHRTAFKTRFFIANATIVDLFKECEFKGLSTDIYNKRVILDVATPQLYLPQEHDTNFVIKMQGNTYCYDLTLPSAFSTRDAYSFMHEDLCRFFNVHVALEKRLMPCLVLNRISAKDMLVSKGGPEVYQFSDDETEVHVQNLYIETLLSFFNNPYLPVVINNSNYKKKIDIELKLKRGQSIVEINKLLRNYGLRLDKSIRPLEVLVIKGKK